MMAVEHKKTTTPANAPIVTTQSCKQPTITSKEVITLRQQQLGHVTLSVGGPAPAIESMKHYVTHKVKNFNTLERACKFCRKVGHWSTECPSLPEDESRRHAYTNILIGHHHTRQPELFSVTTKENRRMMTFDEVRSKVEADGKQLSEGNPWATSELRSDWLRAQLGFWKAIGAGKVTINWIAGGLPIRFATGVEVTRAAFANNKSCNEHVDFISNEIEGGLADGSFMEVAADYLLIANPLKVAYNKRGKLRLCMDLRYPNSHLPKVTFKYETVARHGWQAITRGDVVFTVDLAKAYNSMAVHKEARPALGFMWKNRFFCCVAMPFGASHAPFIFHKIVREAVRLMRLLGLRVMNYLDDFMICCRREDAPVIIGFVRWLLARLGWRYSDKCEWLPAPRGEYLGFVVDCENYSYHMPSSKVTACGELVRETLTAMGSKEEKTLQARLSSVVGVIQSFRLAYAGVQVWTRGIYRAIGALVTQRRLTTEEYHDVVAELRFWEWSLAQPERNGRAISDPAAEIIVTVDAGGVGWGAHCNGTQVNGLFSHEQLGTSSTLRELIGLRMACIALQATLRNHAIKIRMDSLCAIQNLVKGGGPVKGLTEEVKKWCTWCEEGKVTAQYEWIPREENQEADWLSKRGAGNWQLRPWVVEELEMKYGGFNHPWHNHNRICLLVPQPDRVEEMIVKAQLHKLQAVIVHPQFSGQLWLQRVQPFHQHSTQLGLFSHIFATTMEHISAPQWLVEATLFDFTTE
jgi:hypothetical protein